MRDVIGMLGMLAVLLGAVPVEGATAGGESTQPSAEPTGAAEPAATAEPLLVDEKGPKKLLNPPRPGDVWWMREGKGYTLCEAVYKELQRYTPKQLGVCVSSVALRLPGMKELDGWNELDPREHEDLFKRLVQYDPAGVRSTKLDANRLYQEFLTTGGRMRVNTLRVFRHPLGDPVTTYDQPQTVVELRRRTNQELCPASPSLTDMVQTFYVTGDLTEPSAEVKNSEVYAARNARLIEYKGVLHLMKGTDVLTFYRDFGKGWLQSYCDYRFTGTE
jgi:hypothetical protein